MTPRRPRTVAECRAIIAAGRPEIVIRTPAEEADHTLEVARLHIQHGAAYGYMTGARLDDHGRIGTLAADLKAARRLGVPDIEERTAAAVKAAEAIAAPWLGWWE